MGVCLCGWGVGGGGRGWRSYFANHITLRLWEPEVNHDVDHSLIIRPRRSFSLTMIAALNPYFSRSKLKTNRFTAESAASAPEIDKLLTKLNIKT